MIDWLGFCAGGCSRNWLGVWMRAINCLVWWWASILTSFQCGGLNLPWFQCRDRSWLGFGVGVEKALVLPARSKVICFRYGDWNWLVFCDGSKMAWLSCQDRNWLGLCVGSNLTWFHWRVRNWLGFSVGWKTCGVEIEINLFLVSRHHNWLDFIVGIEIRLTWV